MELINRSIYVDKVLSYIGKGLVIVLTGQRRVGKSCILRCTVNEIKKKEPDANVIYINKEYAEFNSIQTDEQLNAYLDHQLIHGRHNYLFIDEIQDIDRFENSIRSLQAHNSCEIVITSSNAKMLSGELSTYLSGRYIEMHIQSLSYNEFLEFHKLHNNDDSLYKYLSFGGLPQLAHIGLDNRQMIYDYLGDIYNTVIMKDVISRENIRNVRFLNDLVHFIADSMGKNISANSISKYMKSQKTTVSPTLVMNYLSYLCNAYIVDFVPRFDIHGRKVFETNEKYYFEDIGLRNSLTGINLRSDIEKLMENAVYIHLRHNNYKVTVGQLQKAEVDFVAERNGVRQYIQVCYQLSSQDTMEREFGNLRNIKDDYRKSVICMDNLATQGEYKGIECLHLRDFLNS